MSAKNHKMTADSDSESSDGNDQNYDFKRRKRGTHREPIRLKSLKVLPNGSLSKFRITKMSPVVSPSPTNGISKTIKISNVKAEVTNVSVPESLRRVPSDPHGSGTTDTSAVTIMDEKTKSEIAEAVKTALKNWKYIPQKINVDEEINWIPPKAAFPLDSSILKGWMKLEPKQTSTDQEHHFCDKTLVENLSQLKTLLGKMNYSDLKLARNRANPFEILKSGAFLNRAAMKIANIDAVLGFALTEPKTQTGEPALGPNEILYFGDICSGPGGFTEYVLWRKKWDAKGFGFTLKGELDFKFCEFFSGPPESFEAYYGPANDGDVYNPNNFRGFVSHVLTHTEGRGVHFMMADGGFSVRGQENQQESLSQHILLSQILFGIGLIRTGGHFVCKTFDIFSSFTVGLIYILYNCFDLVSIIKPITSRPANSERYVICKWKRDRGTCMPIVEYLAKCHEQLWDTCIKKTSENTIVELVPLKVLKSNLDFCEYVCESNKTIGERQLEHLKTVMAFSQDPSLKIENQNEIKSKCIDLWRVPETIKKMLSLGPQPRFKSLSESYDAGFVQKPETDLTLEEIKNVFKSPYDWRCVIVEGGKTNCLRGFFLSLGGGKIFMYRGTEWTKVAVQLSMCKDTVVYGEIVHEIASSGTKVPVFHIIDAMVLGGKDVRNLHYTQRHELCVKFSKSIYIPTSTNIVVRVKNPIRMENVGDLIDRLRFRFIKEVGKGSSYSSLVAPTDHTDEASPVIKPAGILFLKITKDPWLMSCSRSARRKYWFNTVSGESTFDVVEGAIADFLFTMTNRVIWWWDKNMKLTATESSNGKMDNNGAIHFHNIMDHIDCVIPHRTGSNTSSSKA